MSLSLLLILKILFKSNHAAGFGNFYTSSAAYHICASTTNNQVKCWGQGTDYQLGYGYGNKGTTLSTTGDNLDFVAFSSGFLPVDISTGRVHTCALSEDSIVKCWGESTFGECGNGDTSTRSTALSAATLNLGTNFTATKLAMSRYFSCALSLQKDVKCWGQGGLGQLGIGGTDNKGDDANEMGDALEAINFGTDFTPKDIGTNDEGGCVLSEENTIKCWGKNANGECGYGNKNIIGDHLGSNWNVIDLGNNFTPLQLACGGSHNCILSTQGTVKCWGLNDKGQLGYSDTASRGDKSGVAALLTINFGSDFNISQLALGRFHSCALSIQRTIKCWGSNEFGQLGYGDNTNRGDSSTTAVADLFVVQLGNGFIPKAVYCAIDYTCAVSEDDRIKCWGSNSEGNLGLGDVDNRGDGINEMGDALPLVNIGIAFIPTNAPTQIPTNNPTKTPTQFPSESPSQFPSISPSNEPSTSPSKFPSFIPSELPTFKTSEPSNSPSRFPSKPPSSLPSRAPSQLPSKPPSELPSELPSSKPIAAPTKITIAPTESSTITPTSIPKQITSDNNLWIYIIVFIGLCTCILLTFFIGCYILKKKF